jgi:predicted transcriptional regulator
MLNTRARARDCVLELAKSRHHVVLIMDADRFVGVVTERELRPVLEGQVSGGLEASVSDFVNGNPALVDVETRVADAEQQMRLQGTGILVATEDGRVCGVVASEFDR